MLKDIKNILKRIGGRFIIVEDGKPSYVILSFQEFKNLISKISQNPDEEMLENKDSCGVNEKFSDLRQQGAEEMPKSTEVVEEEEPTIEDIPL